MKKYLYDTSVIIAGSIPDHSHHAQSLPWLVAAKGKKIQAYVSSHTVAELYATLTKMPIRPPLSPEFVQTFINQEILPSFECVDLSAKDYEAAILQASQKSLKGGIIYDCLHWQACLKKKLSGIVTLNESDFVLIGDQEKIVVINPLHMQPF